MQDLKWAGSRVFKVMTTIFGAREATFGELIENTRKSFVKRSKVSSNMAMTVIGKKYLWPVAPLYRCEHRAFYFSWHKTPGAPLHLPGASDLLMCRCCLLEISNVFDSNSCFYSTEDTHKFNSQQYNHLSSPFQYQSLRRWKCKCFEYNSPWHHLVDT